MSLLDVPAHLGALAGVVAAGRPLIDLTTVDQQGIEMGARAALTCWICSRPQDARTVRIGVTDGGPAR